MRVAAWINHVQVEYAVLPTMPFVLLPVLLLDCFATPASAGKGASPCVPDQSYG